MNLMGQKGKAVGSGIQCMIVDLMRCLHIKFFCSNGDCSKDRVVRALKNRPNDFPIVGSPRFTIERSTQDAFIAVDTTNNVWYVVPRGTDFGRETVRELVANDVLGFIFGYSRRVDSTMELAQHAFELAGRNNGSVVFCGHSLGGSISKTCGILTGCKYISFNAPDMELMPNNVRIWIPIPSTKPIAVAVDAEAIRTFVDALYPQNAPRRRYTRAEYDEGVNKMHEGQGLEMRNHQDCISGWTTWAKDLFPGNADRRREKEHGKVEHLVFHDNLPRAHSVAGQRAALAHHYNDLTQRLPRPEPPEPHMVEVPTSPAISSSDGHAPGTQVPPLHQYEHKPSAELNPPAEFSDAARQFVRLEGYLKQGMFADLELAFRNAMSSSAAQSSSDEMLRAGLEEAFRAALTDGCAAALQPHMPSDTAANAVGAALVDIAMGIARQEKSGEVAARAAEFTASNLLSHAAGAPVTIGHYHSRQNASLTGNNICVPLCTTSCMTWWSYNLYRRGRV
jgi:hypothetical protein